MNRKAVLLLSGGLDSILAARVMQEQGIDLAAINFLTTFCTCTNKGCRHAATVASETLKIPLKVFNVTKEYLEIVRNPKHGYGSNMNPCIDCRIFIFKKAKEYMKEIGASFLVTGEVLGERPMSQRKDAILFIEKHTELKGLILRPLSAKLFEPTISEKEGIVDRDRLLSISGRSRKPQIALAKGFSIKDYPCPAGGCLLTDPGFAKRVKDLIEHDRLNEDEILLLKVGRHFRVSEYCKLIVGRDDKENVKLEAMAKEDDIFLRMKDKKGPLSLLRGKADASIIAFAASIALHHTKFRDEGEQSLIYWKRDVPKNTITVKPAEFRDVEKMRI